GGRGVWTARPGCGPAWAPGRAGPAGAGLPGDGARAEKGVGGKVAGLKAPLGDSAAVGAAAVGARPAGAARSLVTGKGRGADDDRGRAVGRVDVRKGAAGAVATDPTGAAGPARGLVGREGTVAQQEHGPT